MQVLPAADALLSPRVGISYDRLPIDVGPFVGLSYLAATVGLHAATPAWRQALQLHGTIDGIFFAHLGMEAARAGAPHLAQGVNITVQPRLRVGPWYGSLTLAFDYRAAQFTGATALYSHARYQAMALSDTHLRLGLALGGRF